MALKTGNPKAFFDKRKRKQKKISISAICILKNIEEKKTVTNYNYYVATLKIYYKTILYFTLYRMQHITDKHSSQTSGT